MSFTDAQNQQLSAPLDKVHVAQREQSGRKLFYVEAWHAIAEANRIFGYDAWDRETVEMRLLGEPRMVGDKARVGYFAKVRITVRAGDIDIVREGSGFGSGIDKDVDQAHESALKEAESDAMKRALMTFGNPFGLALYDKTQANVGTANQNRPSGSTLTVATAKIAMDQCGNIDALTKWHAESKPHLDAMSDEDFAAVKAYWVQRRAALSQKEAA